MKNLSEYRIESTGLGHKGNKGIEKFNFVVVSICENTDLIMSKHSTEKAANASCKRYSKNGRTYEVAKL